VHIVAVRYSVVVYRIIGLCKIQKKLYNYTLCNNNTFACRRDRGSTVVTFAAAAAAEVVDNIIGGDSRFQTKHFPIA